MSILDLDQLLDGNLAEVKAAPDYVTPVSGVALLNPIKGELEQFTKTIRVDGKETGEKEEAVRIRVTFSIAEYIEYAEDDAVPIAPESLYSETYQHNEKGLEFFKRDLATWLSCEASELDSVSLRDLLATLETVEPYKAVIKTSTRKFGDNEYTDVKVRRIAE